MTVLAWSEWRNAAIVVVWLTVAGGLLMATIWATRGGFTALGPEDDLVDPDRARPTAGPRRRRATSIGPGQLVGHGVMGLLTAGLVTYGAMLDDDRSGGYVFIIGAILVTAIPGTRMYWKWRHGHRPAVAERIEAEAAARGRGAGAGLEEQRAEDHLPRPVVYLHGLTALGTLAIIVLLLVKDA